MTVLEALSGVDLSDLMALVKALRKLPDELSFEEHERLVQAFDAAGYGPSDLDELWDASRLGT